MGGGDHVHRPSLVVFDLDDTLWFPEMYMLDGLPFTRDKQGRVHDRGGDHVRLIGDSQRILHEIHLHWKDTKVGYASRTHYPKWASACLKLIEVAPGVTMEDVVDVKEIYPGDKTTHFAHFKRKTGIEFHNMLFFDNEIRNVRDVASLGVVAVYTPHGMTMEHWHKGLAQFNQQNAEYN